jgi:hypothetical protein
MANQRTVTNTTRGGKVVIDRQPYEVAVWYHIGVTGEQIEAYVEKFSIFGLKFWYALNDCPVMISEMGRLVCYWFDDDLVDDDDAFIEMLNDDEIVRGAFFGGYMQIPVGTVRTGSDPYTAPIHPDEQNFESSPAFDPALQWNFKNMSLDKAWSLLDTVPEKGFTAVLGVVDRGYFDFYQEMSNRYVVETLPRPDVHLHLPHPICSASLHNARFRRNRDARRSDPCRGELAVCYATGTGDVEIATTNSPRITKFCF